MTDQERPDHSGDAAGIVAATVADRDTSPPVARGWSARDRVPPLDFNLAPYGSAGRIAEPSGVQYNRFLAALRRAARAAGVNPARIAGASSARLARELSALTPERREAITADLLDACEEITAGRPSRADLDRLTVPLQQAFVGWLLGQMVTRDVAREAS